MKDEIPAGVGEAEPRSPRRGGIPLELWVGAVVVLACLGAFFGPGIYWRIRVSGLEKLLLERGPELDYEPLSRLMAMRNTYAEDAIERYADQSPIRCWVPEAKALFLVSEKKRKRSADQAPIEIVLCFKMDTTPERGKSYCGGVIVTRIAWTGERLAVDFKVHPELAAQARTSADKIWTISYTLEEALDGILDESMEITGGPDWKSNTVAAYIGPLLSRAKAQMSRNGGD